MDIKIMVVTHKKYWMPIDSMYLPIQVGADLNDEINFPRYSVRDNIGENISIKNENYCELTAMYWAWKNLDSEYIGLVHYRRYLGINKERKIDRLKENIYTYKQIKNILNDYEVILPKPIVHENGDTVESYYSKNHYAKDLYLTREIVKEKYPLYLSTFEKCMKSDRAHYANIFVMKRDLFNKYSKWLFDILFELEKRVDITEYNSHQKRIYGFISERLLDVFIKYNNVKIYEADCVHLEPKQKLTLKQKLRRSFGKRIKSIKEILRR